MPTGITMTGWTVLGGVVVVLGTVLGRAVVGFGTAGEVPEHVHNTQPFCPRLKQDG